MRKNRFVYLLALGAFFISFSGVYVELANVSPMVAGFYRTGFGSITLAVASLFFLGRARFRLTHKDQLYIIGAGSVFFINLNLWHTCVLLLGPGLATLIGNFQVFLMVLIGAMLFKERLSLKLILGVVLAFGGLVLIIGLDVGGLADKYMRGLVYGFLGAVFFTVYILLIRQIQKGSKNPATFNLCLVTLISSVLFYLQIIMSQNTFFVSNSAMGWLLLYGVFSQAVGWFIIALCLPNLPASLSGLIILLQPALAFFWDIFFFEQQLSGRNIVGLFFVLFGLYVANIQKRPSLIHKPLEKEI